MRCAVLVALWVLVVACSGKSKRRVLARDVKMEQCVVDEHFVYVDADDGLFKVSRSTGDLEFLTNDKRGLNAMVPVDGDLYWLDLDGVHVLKHGQHTRTSVARFGVGADARTLVRFGKKLCWGRRVEDLNTRIECIEPGTTEQSPQTWIDLPGVAVELVTSRDRFLAAASTVDCTLFDISTPNAPPHPLFADHAACSGFYMTPEGPALLRIPGGYEEPKYLLIGESDPRRVEVPDDVGGLVTIGPRTYLQSRGGPAEIDLRSGALSPVGGIRYAICGDLDNLYVRDKSDSLVEIRTSAQGK